MRKHLKRALAMVLAVAMVLTMLPAVFAAGSYAITPLSGIPEDNQTVVIYSAAATAVLGGTADGGKIPSAAVKDNTVTTGAGAYKLMKNSDGTYYITNGGRYLTTDSAEKFTFESAPKTGSKWDLIVSAQADYPGYLIKNHEVKYNGWGDIYVEYYGSTFSGYSLKEDTYSIYVFNFYSVADDADTDGDGYIGGTRPSTGGNLPVEGDQVVVYSPYAKMCFGIPEDDTGLTGVESTLTGSTLEPGNGSLIFTIHVSGNYYTFANTYVDETGKIGTRYLRASENPKESGVANPENIYFDTTESNYTQWTLEPVTGGYVMYNREAKYNGNSVCIEYFSNMFSGWTYNGSANLFAMQFFKVTDEHNAGYVVNPKANITAKDAQMGVDYEFIVELDDLSKITALDVTYTTNGGTAAKSEGVADQNDDHKYTFTVPKAALEGKTSLTLNVSATNTYGITYTATAEVKILDEPYIISVTPSPNSGTEAEKRPEIAALIANCGSNPTVTMTVNDNPVTPTVTADKISYRSDANMNDGKYVVTVKIVRADGKTAEQTWSFFVGAPGLTAYFGQLHSHTAEYSDGAGQLEDAYEYAMNVAKDVDFLIVTDHSNYFDTTTTATMTSYYDLSSLTKGNSKSKWEEAKETAELYNAKSDTFVAAYGYEMTWSGGPGHTNTFNTYGVVSRNNSSLNEKSNSYAGMHLYNDLMVNANNGLDVDGNPVAEGVKTKWIEEAPVVSQFNHPGTTFGTFDDFAGYTPARDAILNLVEVGNGEGAVGGGSYFPSYSEYDKALGKGWHVAPTNNQDNHKGRWGDANTCRDVILTDDFTEVGLYNAIAARRVYSTEDQNLTIYYYLNDHLMGDIIDTGDTEVKDVHITASITDPDREELGKVEVIGEAGATLKTVEMKGSTYELDITLPNTAAYYYLRITQADGDIAVTAPVWVGAATPITATLKTDANLNIVGEEETLTATVDNEAEGDFTLNKIELRLNAGDKETLVQTIDKNVVVKFGEKYTEDIKYIRTESGTQTLTVSFIGTYGGKAFTATANLTSKVYQPSELVNVAVDYGHDNYYITGDYADNAGNFLDFCAQNGVRGVAIQKGEFTYANLSQYDLLVLTVNYRRNTAKAVDYTEQEIADLAKFVENGGSVIICSKSDRDNTFDNCAENTNKLLEAIGAHTRMVNGIIVDNEQKANEAYRVYFSSKDNINPDHRFTKGIYTSSNAFGTTPSPSNQTGFQVYNGGPVEILEGYEDKVEVLVKGYDTTWGSHYDGYFTGASFVPEYDENDPSKVTVKMGDVNVMTYEDTPAGGWILTSGVTFFSNYDIKSDQDYANRFLLQNILRDLTGADAKETVTPIKTVKEKTEGEFTIEGYITSNASAYDQDTAFFDCIYVQDKNGNGINVFPVAGNYAIGMNVRCHGGVTFYCGEIELNLSTDYNGYIRVVSDELYNIPPKDVDCATAMADSSIGNLMRVRGIVVNIHKTEGVIDKIYVRDAAGVACLFINGYINSDDHTLDNTLQIGMLVSGVGIGSRDVDETSTDNAIFSRLRVRTRSEIQILDSKPHYGELFTDVKESDWFFDEVVYAVQHGLLLGTSYEEFSPNTKLTRAMAATVLYRMAGEPLANSKTNFKDVEEGRYYTDAVTWAESNGIVNGFEDNTFRPNEIVTREQMAAMLARYAKNIAKVDTTVKNGSLAQFPDSGDVSNFAKEAIQWCVENGIINGSSGKLLPKDGATRAEFAAIAGRFDALAEKTEPAE